LPTQHPRPKVSTTTRQGGGSAAIALRVSKSTKIRQEYLWPCAPNGATLKPSNRRHQRWTTRHPIRLQECADRRPLLQQSCSDLRFPGPPADHPMHRPRCPRVTETDPMDVMAPGAAFCSSAPNSLFRSSNDHQKLTLLDGRCMVPAWNLVPVRPHHPSRPDGPLVASALTRPPGSRPTHPRTPASTAGGHREGTVATEARSIKDRVFS